MYRSGEEKVKFNGVKSEEGIAKFLVKFLGDNILVSADIPELSDCCLSNTQNKFQFFFLFAGQQNRNPGDFQRTQRIVQ